VDIFEFVLDCKTMAKKTQTESPAFNPDEFAKLWQDKWAQMMKEKGWPEGTAMPNMGQMPFLMPFMPNFSGFGAATDNAMQSRIEELEKRIARLEKQMAQRSKPATKKPVRQK
jgi:hypothetical protein